MLGILLAKEFALYMITLVSVVISLVFALLYKFLVPQARAKEIKAELLGLREKMATARKTKNGKELKLLTERSLKLSNQQMMMTMKPLIASMIIITIVLPLLANTYPGILFKMPFWLPLFGPDVSWLGLYIIISLPVTFVFRKLLGVD